MEKSPSSVLRARLLSWLAPYGMALPLALAGCGGAASPAGTAKSAVAPTQAAGTKRHLTPELVATLPESFEESRTGEGELIWFDPGSGFGVRGSVLPVPFGQLSTEMRKTLAEEHPDVRIEDKSRGKDRTLEITEHEDAPVRQLFLTVAHVTDAKSSVIVSCASLSDTVRATCKEAIDSVWFAPNERARPKAAPAGKRWLEQLGVYMLVPGDFLPDASVEDGMGVMKEQTRLSYAVMDKAARVSLADSLRKRMNTDATAFGAETPLKRTSGSGTSLEVVHAVQVGESATVVSRLFPISATASALTICSAPERVFQAQPKRCAALLDAIEVVTPTPLVNARAEGGSVVR
jgi:hypothetical protein